MNTIKRPCDFVHIAEKSCYNHNFYCNVKTGEVILDEAYEFPSDYSEFYLIKDGKQIYHRDAYFGEYEWTQENDIVLTQGY
jgi:hypothetical protein